MAFLIAALAATSFAGIAVSAPDRSAAAHQAQIEARVPFAPMAVAGSDGHRHLAYEIQITSFNSDSAPLTIESLSVFADGSRKLLDVAGPALNALLAHPLDKPQVAKGIAIASGARQTLFVWLTLPDGAVPKTLRHEIILRKSDGGIQRADGIITAVDSQVPVTIGPPLRDGRWLVTEGPGNPQSHHWGSPVAINGQLTIPQRYAVDWFGLDEAGHSLRRKVDSLAASADSDWVGFDSDVLAVADGVVRDVRNDAPDGKPLAPQAVPDDLTARSLYGNFVVLEIAPGVFVHYAHLRKGSVTVKIGQRIRRGAVIGRLGQSGAAGAPHLHFQLSNRATFEESEGLPFTIDDFSLVGRTAIEATFDTDAVPPSAAPSRPRRNAMPLDGDVVRFASRAGR